MLRFTIYSKKKLQKILNQEIKEASFLFLVRAVFTNINFKKNSNFNQISSEKA